MMMPKMGVSMHKHKSRHRVYMKAGAVGAVATVKKNEWIQCRRGTVGWVCRGA